MSAHTLRHSFAVHYMQQGGDIYKLSRLMGHENTHTTERYLVQPSKREMPGSAVAVSWTG